MLIQYTILSNFGRSCEAVDARMEASMNPDSSDSSCSSDSNKRPRSSPTLLTPTQRSKRAPLRELVQNSSLDSSSSAIPVPRRLSYQSTDQDRILPHERWMDAEVKALIEFILLHSTGENWPSHKQMKFWTSERRSGSDTSRSGMLVLAGCMYANYSLQLVLANSKLLAT